MDIEEDTQCYAAMILMENMQLAVILTTEGMVIV